MKNLRKLARRFVPHFVTTIRVHYMCHGAMPKIFNPQTMNEKICYRKLFDRRPILTRFTDKYAVRSYVKERLGPDILPKLYHVTKNPSDIPFDSLPGKFVVKPTHGSGWTWLVTDKSTLDKDALIAKCNEWLGSDYYEETREWPYKGIEPRILVEEFIDDGSKVTPTDYKFFVFDGVVRLIQAHQDRYKGQRISLHKPSWERFEVLDKDYTCSLSEEVARPAFLEEMIKVAEILGKGMDFIRVDLYSTKDKIYFGELTTVPTNGMTRYEPVEFDYYLGQFWDLQKRA